jgi:hypothetical protein
MVVVALCSVFLFSGCALNKEFVKAVDGYAHTFIPEYKTYIANDPNLDDETKRIRTQSADKFLETVTNAVKEVEE